MSPRASKSGRWRRHATSPQASILVVEDNPITRKLIRTVLHGAGFGVREAEDGAAAIKEVAASVPDLVVQDLLLPDIEGVRLLDRLREQPGMREVPVIACSGLVGSLEEAKSLRAAFTDYIFKPIEPDVFLDVVARYLPGHLAESPISGGGPKVLLVDDDPVQRKLGKLVLDRAGFEVTVCGDAAEALAVARRTPPDVVLSDLLMPGTNGLELCVAIRRDETLGRVPVVLTSNTFGNIGAEDLETARQAGASDLVLRTAGFENVIEALNSALGEISPQAPGADATTIAHRYAEGVVRQLEHQGQLNVELTRRLAHQAAQIGMMTATAELLASSAPPHEVLEQILGRVLDATGGSDGAVLLMEDGRLGLAAYVGRASNFQGQLVNGLQRSGLLDRVQGGETLVIPSPSVPGAVAEEITRVADARCIVLAPLVAAGQQEGLLVISSSRPELGRDGAVSAQAIAMQLAQSLVLARTMERLRQSERQYRDLFEGAADAIIIANVDGVFVDANVRASELTGHPLDELRGMSVTDVFVPDESPRVTAGFAAALAGQHRTVERRVRRKDGTIVPVEISAQPLSDGRVHGIFRDITERKQAEAKIQDRERQLDAIVQAVNDIVFEFDAEGTYLSIWAADESQLAAPKSELLGRRVTDILGETEAEFFIQCFRRVMQTGVPETFEYSLTVSGGERHFMSRVTLLPGIRNAPDTVCMGIADITDRKSAESALRESEERFRLLAEHIKEAFFLVEMDSGRAVYLSPTFEDIWGIPVEDVYSRPELWIEGIHSDDRAEMGAAIGQVQSGQATNTLFRIVRPDGTTRWARSRAFPVSDSNRIVGVVEDITELRQVEQQAVQAQKMEAVARLAGGVAHDFNNLLTVIMGEADLVLSLEELPESIAESLSEVRKAGERASVLTRQLLAFSRKQLIEPDIYDVNEIVQDMEKMLRRLIGEDIVFATRLAGRELNVRVDRGQMEQVLANLAVNARDALPDGGMLSIETSRIHLDDEGGRTYEQLAAGDYIVLSVTDNGTGMSTEVLTRIFEPFFTTKGEGKGTGLGLATCYAIIKGAGGHIAAYSEVGVGTTMRVYIPAIEVATTKSRTSVKSALPRGNETVLLVEDDAAVRRVATRILQSLGYQVLEAAGGRDALVPLADPGVHVDLLLTDVVMPGMSGRTVAERALQLRPQLKILFASGYTDDMILQQRLLEEGARLVQKPLTPEGLARRVRDVLDAEK